MKTLKLTKLEARFLANLALAERNDGCKHQINTYNCKDQKEYAKKFSILTDKLTRLDKSFYK